MGKTAAAVNLAVVLARTRRMLAVDVDPRCALTRQLDHAGADDAG